MNRPRRGRPAASLRPLGLPQPLDVRTDGEGLPVAVTRTARRGMPGRVVRVESVEEVWRVSEAWWREAPQARTYYRVILEDGRLLTLFRDDQSGAWSEQQYPERT